MNYISSNSDEWTPILLNIPPHWEQIDFEDAFDNISIADRKVPQKDYLPSGTIPIVDQGVDLVGGFTNDATKSIRSTGPLIVFGDHTKCFKLVGFRFAPGADGVKVLKPIIIDERFAYYACRALQLPDRGYSRHYSFLKKGKIPLAPPNEQHRIVAKIEELFSELDKGIESLKAARAKLDVYRQAVLKHAFEGKLTDQWREENKDRLETPEQLLARIKQEQEARYEQQLQEWKATVKDWEEGGKSGKSPSRPKKQEDIPHLSLTETETLPPLPIGWSYLRLGLVIDEPKYGSSKKCNYDYKGTGVLRIPNVVRGTVDPSDLKGAYFEEDEKSAYGLRRGDILVIRSNGSISIVGRCALISKAEEQYLYAGYLIRLRSNLTLSHPEYLVALLSSHLLRTQIEHKAKSTSGVNNINSGEIQSLIIPLCSLNEQEVIVERLSASLSSINTVKGEIDSQLLKVNALRQSILKKAFAGQLVPKDPKDEPASILLERIKEEKTIRSQNNKRTKRRRAKATA